MNRYIDRLWLTCCIAKLCKDSTLEVISVSRGSDKDDRGSVERTHPTAAITETHWSAGISGFDNDAYTNKLENTKV